MRDVSPADILSLRAVSDPQVSPDGAHVAYVVEWCDPVADRVRSAVWIDGERATWGDWRDRAPRWCPDGRALAFVSDRSGSGQLWLLPLAGGDPRRLTDIPYAPRDPVWSPSGDRILFSARKAPPRGGVVQPQVVTRLRYLLNGSHFVGDGFWQVFSVGRDGGAVRQLTADGWHHFAPTFSPDGSRIAFTTTRRPDWDLEWVWDVHTAAADGGDLRRVTGGDGVCLAPAYSPDGTRIAYLANGNPTTGSTADYHVRIVAADGGEARDLTADLDRGAAGREPPASQPPCLWSPDGGSLLWVGRQGGVTRLCRTRVGDGVHQWCGPDQGAAGWPTASRDGGRVAFTFADPARAPEVVTLAGERVSDANAWMGELRTARPRVLRLAAPDGNQFQSLLWTPGGAEEGADARPGGPWPTILDIHGGPHGAVGPAFSLRHQMLVAAGFAVVSVNYRGSAGYGQGFADLIHGDWGVREFEDCMAAVDHLVAAGVADPARLGVTGGSYGGFMTNYVITHTTRFRAAVSLSTIASLQTLAYTIDHWESIATDQDGPPYVRPRYYAEHSPITHVQRVQTPLLILHGEADDTCPVAEADQFFAALRMQRKPVMLVRYPGDPHGFILSGRPTTRLDAHRRLLGWFREHLG